MRTTLTLDPDVAVRLEELMRQNGGSFKSTVNEVLRRGLAGSGVVPSLPAFRVRARDLKARPGVNFDNTAELLATLDEPYSL